MFLGQVSNTVSNTGFKSLLEIPVDKGDNACRKETTDTNTTGPQPKIAEERGDI